MRQIARTSRRGLAATLYWFRTRGGGDVPLRQSPDIDDPSTFRCL
jgi:hypothetical protein